MRFYKKTQINKFFVVLILLSLTISFLFIESQVTSLHKVIKYIPIGDSLTIGEGVDKIDSYPSLLTNDLQKHGKNVWLITNPARLGYTIQKAIETELPIVTRNKPDLVTVLIGANDRAQKIGIQTFKIKFAYLLDSLLSDVNDKNNIIVMTIYDYSMTPQGRALDKIPKYKEENAISIEQYNQVIKEEAKKRNLKIVDLFSFSHQIPNDISMYTKDGSHPSAKQYALWEKKIFPIINIALK